MAENAAADEVKTAAKAFSGKEAAIKTALKTSVGDILKVDNKVMSDELYLKRIAEAIAGPIMKDEKTAPKTEADKAKLAAEASTLAKKLFDMKKADKGDPANAIKAFNDGLDKADFPMGIAVGGGAGLLAAVATDIGDWKSFGGIMKKLALVAAGVGVGIAVNNDMGLRDQALSYVNMGPLAKKDDKGAAKS